MKGSSLIEVLISLVVLSLAITVAITVQLQGLSAIRASVWEGKANQLLANAVNESEAGAPVSLWQQAWQDEVAETLPEGEGLLAGTPQRVSVEVRWYDQSVGRMRVLQGVV